MGKLSGLIWGMMLFAAFYGMTIALFVIMMTVAVNATNIFCSTPDWGSTLVGTVVGLLFGFTILPLYLICQKRKGHG